jgi:hypothetical protein
LNFLRNQLILLFCTSLLCASNFHEHLFSLPYAKNIVKVSDAIFSIPENSQRLSCFFETENFLRQFIEKKWDKEAVERFLKGGGYTKSIADLCKKMPGDPKENLHRLLSFDLQGSYEERRTAYIAIEDMRKAFFLALSLKDFETVYRDYFECDPLINRQIISATVTQRFFAREQKKKYRALKKLAKEYGSLLLYRVSLQRNALLQRGVSLSEECKALLLRKEIAGIDLVGSLKEDRYVYSQDKEMLKRKIKELFEFSATHSLILFLHLFESAHDDPFYGALEEIIAAFQQPIALQIGHIATLNEKWIKLFSSNPALSVLFQANIQSNVILHGSDLKVLEKNILLLSQEGFQVVLGSDGQGILPRASFLEQSQIFPFLVKDQRRAVEFFLKKIIP